MHYAKKWQYETMGRTVVKALQRNGFGAVYAEDREAACREILAMIPKGASIGFGGSVTIEDCGILDPLKAGDYRLINPPYLKAKLPTEEWVALRYPAVQADVFLASTNAITKDGKLVSTDGTGNRVVGMIFGPKKTIIIAGANKIVRTLEAALERVSLVAGPAAARRNDYPAPCRVNGLCIDCNAETRICNATVILHRKTRMLDLSVVLVGEELGF